MLIAISAKIGGGKDTVASIIKKIDNSRNWENKKFAGTLKQIASILTGVEVEKFESQEFKKQQMSSEWIGCDGLPMTYRTFLQRLGTEAVRDCICQDAWVNALMASYKVKRTKVEDEEYNSNFPDWIISDCRFPQEVDAVSKRGGYVIRLTRNTSEVVNEHHSETALDGYDFDYTINNNGSLEDLEKEVIKMLQHFKII